MDPLEYSRYARQLVAAKPELSEELERSKDLGWTSEAMEAFLRERGGGGEGALDSGLRLLRRRVMLRTMARDLSGYADLGEVCGTMSALAEVAIDAALAHFRHEDLVVVGMGKLGGGELNVSSDVDLVFLYPEEGDRAADKLEFYTRLGRRLIAALDESTGDGFVFRVDMRLRPWGESGALATSFGALEEYFVTQGREWERYAWIKARALGSGGENEALAAIVHPFVYRKYLDYGAVAARAMGFDSWEAFRAALDRHRARVSSQFEQVFSVEEVPKHALAPLWTGSEPGRLAQLGFRDAAGTAARLAALRSGPRYEGLPQASRTRFDALIPRIIEQSAEREDPDPALARCLEFVETVSRRAAHLALLDDHPAALERLAQLLAASSWAAEYLNRHPIVLDELLDARALFARPDWNAFALGLRRQLIARQGDEERQMDRLRQAHHAQVFRLLAQDLSGLLGVERLPADLSQLSDVMLQVTLELCWAQLPVRDRDEPPFAVIGYGQLGGERIGSASDLDLIFLYDDSDDRAPEIYAPLAPRPNLWLTSRTPAGALYDIHPPPPP